MASGDGVKRFQAVRLAGGRELASGQGHKLPPHVLEAALQAYLAEDCSVAVRVDNETILQIHCRTGFDCCACESEPQMQPVDLRIDPKMWGRGI